METRLIAFIVLCSAVCACDTTTVPASAPGDCAQRWWVESTPSSCSGCTDGGAILECAQPDCVQVSFEGFQKGGAVYDGVLAYSAKTGSISSVAPCVRRNYTENGTQVQIAGANGSLTCSAERLSGPYYYKVAADATMSAALDRAFLSGALTFSNVPTR